MDFDFKPEFKCKNCTKAEKYHKAGTKNCPCGSKTRIGYTDYDSTEVYVSSGRLTPESKAKLYEHERRKAREEAEAAEKAKVRAMTFEEVVTATCELLTEITGLGIIVEREYPGSAHIHLTNLGGKIRLGYTSVTQYSSGSYGVGGTSAGCFMSNHSDACIANVIRQPFRDLENRANEEKSK